jgi:predicted MFS family arabinose efflux permease
VLSAPAGAFALLAPSAWRIATAVAAVPAMLTALLALCQAPSITVPAPNVAGRFELRDLARPQNAFFVAAYGGFGAAYIAYATFAVASFTAHGLAATAIGAIWAELGAVAVLGAIATGRILSGRFRAWALAMPLGTGAVGALCSSTPSLTGAVAGALCVGAGLAAVPAVASAFARDRSDAASYAGAFAVVTSVFGFGQLAGPLVAGVVADRFGVAATPLFAAAIFSASTVCAIIDARRALQTAR